MNQEWMDFLRRHGLAGEGRDFGAPADELAAARAATVLAPLTDIGLIRASGPDAATFLHNLLTNDIEGLPKDGVRRCGLCTPKGRLLASMLVWHDGEGENGSLLVAVAADLHAALLKKLSMYVLRSRVKLSDAGSERVLLGLSGPQAATALGAFGGVPATPMKLGPVAGGQILRLGEARFLLCLDGAAAPGAWETLARQAQPVGLDAWRWLEIIAGLPQITLATQEAFIPQMINFETEAVGGVSFKKGCYPGQEIVARTQYLGKVKRRMYRARIESGTPAAGAHLYAPETGDQSCGQVVNAAPAPGGGHEVLAVIQAACADAGEVHLDSPAGPRLILQPLPYAA